MHIVIIDDNPVNITLLQHLVKQLVGATFSSYTDSAIALEWCLANQPDLILVDYMMPAPDGIAFTKALRESTHHADTPVIMITANSENFVRYAALEAGANDFLTKPVDRTEFLSRSRNMLALRKSQLALADRAAWLAEEVAKATAEIKAREYDTIVRLSKAAEYRDPETGMHILRMARYSQIIGRKLGLPEDQLELLLQAAPMHDIGKVGTPDHILLKPGRLDSNEMVIMRQHASIGYEILKDSDSPLLQMAAEIANTHHEKFDGSGYPNGLKGEEIALVGRIVAVADVFDALTSVRPYKPAWEIDRAIQFMKEQRGLHFDPVCLDAFFESWDAVMQVRDECQEVDVKTDPIP